MTISLSVKGSRSRLKKSSEWVMKLKQWADSLVVKKLEKRIMKRRVIAIQASLRQFTRKMFCSITAWLDFGNKQLVEGSLFDIITRLLGVKINTLYYICFDFGKNLKLFFLIFILLRGQTVHFLHCKRFPQQGSSLCSSFVLSFCLIDRSDKILTCLKTCVWNPGAYRHKFVRLSSAHFGLVISIVINWTLLHRTHKAVGPFRILAW